MAAKKKSDDDDDRDEDETSEEESSKADSESVERDASTKGVAKALGVDDDEEAEEGEEAEEEEDKPAAPANRAARRRDDALRRRAAREGKVAAAATVTKKPAKSSDEDGEEGGEEEEEEEAPVVKARDPLPKDRNARAKELLRRRQESIDTKKPIGLTAGEAVQDQLARAASGTTRWLRNNFKYVIGGLVIAVGATAGILYYLDRQEATKAKSSDTLMAALKAERGEIIAEGETPDPMAAQAKEIDPLPTFPTFAARADAAVAAYEKVISEHPGTGVAILAKLGKAGAYLDKGESDPALALYNEVIGTELAKADVDVKARAIEGKGLALELKKDLDGALAAFRDLETADKAFEDLGKYHQARIHFKKGEKDRAKELLLALFKKLELPEADGAPRQRQLRVGVEQYLRTIDPKAVPKKARPNNPFGEGGPKSLEELQEWAKQQGMDLNTHGDDHGDGDDHGMPPMPVPMPAPVPEQPNDAPPPGGDDGTR